MDRRLALALTFSALLVGVTLVALTLPAQTDPLTEFRNADGGMTIPGGKFTRELQNLLFPPKPPETYTTYAPERSTYQTLAIEGTENDYRRAAILSQSDVDASWRSLFGGVADWLGLDGMAQDVQWFFSFDWLVGNAVAVNRFAVFNDAECTATAVSTDADCWSTTSGGNGDGAPVSGDSLVLDTGVSPFTATGTMDANLSLGAQTVTLCSAAATPIAACGGNFTGTFAISTFSLTFTGTFTMVDSGGTVSVSTGTINGGTATLTSAADLSITGAATLTFDSMTLTAGTLAKGTATLTLDTAGLTMDGGDLTSTSGAVVVTTAVNISSTSSAIDFGSETWTVSGAFDCESTDTAVWEAGTGLILFDSATGDSTFTPCNFTSENHFSGVEFDSTATTAQTWTLVTRTLVFGGTMTIEDSGAEAVSNVLDTGASIAITGGAITVGTGGTLTANGSTITMNNNFTSSAGTFTQGTSTLVFATSATLTVASGSDRGVSRLYNLTVNSGVTVTLGTLLGISNTLTLNGTIAPAGLNLILNSGAATALSCTSGTVNSGGISIFNATGSTTLSITTACTWNQTLQIENGTSPDAALTYTVSGGPLTLGGADNFLADIVGAGSAVTLAMGTNALTTSSGTTNVGYSVGGTTGILTFSSGAWTATTVNVATAASGIQLGSSTSHTVSGTWTNATTSAANWDAGTGTVTFNSATGGTMTFAGTNLAENELNNVTFDSSATTAQTFTMATRGLRYGGTLIVDDVGAEAVNNTLDTSGSNLAITGGGLTLGAGGTLTLNGSTVTANAAWNFSSGTYNEGTSTLTVATSSTVTPNSAGFPNSNIASVTVNTGITMTVGDNILRLDENSTLTNNGTITSAGLRLDINVDGSPASPIAALGTVSGLGGMAIASCTNTTYSANLPGGTYPGPMFIINVNAATGCTGGGTLTVATFTVTTSAMTVDSDGILTINNNDGANNGSITLDLSASNFGLTLSATGTHIIGDSLATGIAAINARGSTVSVSGAVSIGSNDYLDLGTSTWTVSGAWTNATTTASWNAGTSTVTFDSATGGTMTFAGANLAEAEFNSLTFTSSAGTAQTFTMATRGLRWLTTLTVSDASSTTALASADLALGAAADTAAITIGNGGILTANASTVLINAFTMTGGTSGTLTITTGAWTVSGNWDSSGAGSVFTQGTGIHTFDATATITLLSTDNTFDDLTISAGTVTLGSAVIITNALTISGGTFAKSTFAITSAGSLTMSGGDLTSTSGAVTITGAVDINSAASAIDFGSEAWTVSGTWTNASTDGTVWEAGTGTVTFDSATGGTMTFAGANLAESEFNNATFSSSAGTDQTFTMATRGLRLGGTLNISDAAGQTNLDTSGSNLSIQTGVLTLDGPLEVLTANGSTITLDSAGGSSNISGSFVRGSSTIVIAANHTLTTGDLASGAGETTTEGVENLTVNASVTLTVPGSCIDVDEVLTVNGTLGGASGCIRFYIDIGDVTPLVLGGSASISGISDIQYRFDDSFTVATSYTIPAATYPILLFYESGGSSTAGLDMTLNAGGAITSTDLRFNNDDGGDNLDLLFNTTSLNSYALTVNGPLRIGLTAQTGGITANGSTISVTGTTTIGADGFISFGTSSWTLTGATWTNSSTNTTDWDAGTATVTFNAGAASTLTFAGANMAEAEFFNLTFNSTAAITYTMATRGLRWLNTLSITDTATTVALATADLALGAAADSPDISIGNLGTLTANASTVIISTFTMTGGTSGTLTITTGAWTVSGNWNSSGAGSIFTQGTGIHTFDATATITLLSTDNTFDDLTISAGTSTLGSAVVVTNAVIATGGTLNTSGVSNFAVTAGTVTIGASGVITANASTITVNGNWDSSAGTFTFGTSNVVFATSGNVNNPSNFYTMTVNASITATLTADLRVRNQLSASAASASVTGSGTRTLTLGTSGPASATNPLTLNGQSISGVTTVVYDISDTANVAGGTYNNLTLQGGAAYTLVTANLTVNATLTLSSGAFSKGTSPPFELSTATLTLSGGSLTSVSGSVTVTGNVNVSSATSFIDFGSEAWTVSGTWTNSTTSASWDAGTGTVTFTSATGGTMTFAGTNLSEDEFSAVSFESSGAASQTFTMATRGLRLGGALTISDDTGGTILAKGTLTLTAGTLDLSGAAGGAITSTSGDVTVGASTMTANSYIDFGSEIWTVTGGWNNSTTSSSWDAGTGTVTFTSSSAATITPANFTTPEPEFASVTFNSSAATAVTFTIATRSLRFATTLTIADTSSTTTVSVGSNSIVGDTSATIDMTDADGRLTFTTGDIVDVSDLNITGGQMTMDGVSGITDIRIQSTSPDDFDITAWTLYSITSGGIPDIRWTMDPDVGNTNVTVTAEGLTASTMFSIYRDSVDILQAASDGSGVVTFTGGALNSGWSSHTMIINLPGLTFGGGGGGGGGGGVEPTVSWTWRHLSEDLTVQFVVTSPFSTWKYEWYVGDRKIGEGPVLEYTFERSGEYEVTLKATHPLGRVFNTVEDVIAKSITFVGRYMPLLLLLVIAIWYFMLVAASDPKRGPFVSDGGKLGGMFFGIVLLGVAGYLLSRAYFTVPLGSFTAIQLYAGVGLVAAAGPLRNRFIKLVAFGMGIALLAFGYLSLVPSL